MSNLKEQDHVNIPILHIYTYTYILHTYIHISCTLLIAMNRYVRISLFKKYIDDIDDTDSKLI